MNERTALRTAVQAITAAALAALVACCVALPVQAEAATLSAGSGSASKALTVQSAKKKAKVYKIRTAKQWHNISKYKGGTFKVMKDIKLTSTKQYLTIKKNKKYTINLNGHTVKTTYTGAALRTACPLHVAKGTVVLTNGKKKGMLYSTETAAVTLSGKSKFYLKNATVVNNATEFRSDITSGIYAAGSSSCYLQGTSAVQSIGNGVALLEKSKLYTTGSPYVRAGANEYKGQFTHYGCGINIASRNASVSLKGGSFGTKASPDITLWSPAVSMTYAQSANYPILDQFGYAIDPTTGKIGLGAGYKYVDANGNDVQVRGSNLSDYYNGVTAPSWDALLASYGFKTEKRLTTTVTDANGYYTVYVVKG